MILNKTKASNAGEPNTVINNKVITLIGKIKPKLVAIKL